MMKDKKSLVYDPGGVMSYRSLAREAGTPLDLRDFREERAPSAVWTTYHSTWRDNVTLGTWILWRQAITCYSNTRRTAYGQCLSCYE
jgi:hypothetical protein